MSKLINDTLKYATLGKTKEEHIVVYLKPLVEEKLKDLTYLFQESNAKIDIDLPSRKVNCNPEQIGVLFYNLISNGIKFNDSTIPYIRIGFEDRGQEWLFYISDNGIGIEQEYSEVVFKAFKKLESTRKYPSSGIGLSLCKKIVDLHNGDIWHKPGKKEGTTFFFTLPKK
jgi:light-regulated signal transduction histidine kinase (bacteriophytochrome)